MIKRYKNKRIRRAIRVRAKVEGTTVRPRLTVFRSLKSVYAQIIDDSKGITLAAASGREPAAIGEELAKKAQLKKITQVVFDRGRYRYLGRIRRLAEAARKGGLKF